MWDHHYYGINKIVQNIFSKNKNMHLPCCSWWFSNESKKQWLIVMKYEVECIKKYSLSLIVQNIYLVKTKQCTHLNVTINVKLNWQKWMREINCDGECIKTMEWVKLYKIVWSWNKQIHLPHFSQQSQLIEEMIPDVYHICILQYLIPPQGTRT